MIDRGLLVPRLLASCKYDESVSYSKFSLGVHYAIDNIVDYIIYDYADSSSMGVVSSPRPVETSADVALPCFD